jgi:hypothetical protein
MGVTDAEGKVTLTIPAGFNGVVSYEPLDTAGPNAEYVRVVARLYALYEPLLQPDQALTLPMNSWADWEDQLQFATKPNPKLGNLELHAFHCAPEPSKQVGPTAKGISFELDPVDPGAALFYGRFGQAVASETDASGVGFFLNLQPNMYTIRFIRRETGECVGQDTVIVRAGVATDATMLFPHSCD